MLWHRAADFGNADYFLPEPIHVTPIHGVKVYVGEGVNFVLPTPIRVTKIRGSRPTPSKAG